jgi:hypothetical protein
LTAGVLFIAVYSLSGNELDLVILDTSSSFFRLGAKYASYSCRGFKSSCELDESMILKKSEAKGGELVDRI